MLRYLGTSSNTCSYPPPSPAPAACPVSSLACIAMACVMCRHKQAKETWGNDQHRAYDREVFRSVTALNIPAVDQPASHDYFRVTPPHCALCRRCACYLLGATRQWLAAVSLQLGDQDRRLIPGQCRHSRTLSSGPTLERVIRSGMQTFQTGNEVH
jgi:hypothetical protein